MKGPHIDWAAISPLIALTVGACLVLMAGLLRPAFVRTTLVPGLTIVTLGVTAGLGVWQWDENESVIAGALAIDDLTLALLMIFVAGALGRHAAVDRARWRQPRPGTASTTRCCWWRCSAWSCSRARRTS